MDGTDTSAPPGTDPLADAAKEEKPAAEARPVPGGSRASRERRSNLPSESWKRKAFGIYPYLVLVNRT